jgi:hypothetical protein
LNPYMVKLIMGKKIIGEGVTRIVFDLENGCVIKVAKTVHGINGNNAEAIIYKLAPPTIRKHLAKVIKHGSDWLIMKKYDLTIPKSKSYKRKLSILIAKLQKEGIIYADITRGHNKPNRKNLRIDRDGKIIVIDYGNFTRK